jgi:hypothetical protein
MFSPAAGKRAAALSAKRATPINPFRPSGRYGRERRAQSEEDSALGTPELPRLKWDTV